LILIEIFELLLSTEGYREALQSLFLLSIPLMQVQPWKPLAPVQTRLAIDQDVRKRCCAFRKKGGILNSKHARLLNLPGNKTLLIGKCRIEYEPP
jgi:hypothetical protein